MKKYLNTFLAIVLLCLVVFVSRQEHVLGAQRTVPWNYNTTLNAVYPYGNPDLSVKVGIGTTSPYAALSVVGQTVSSYYTATSTTATSTFANGLSVTSGCLSQNGTCLTTTYDSRYLKLDTSNDPLTAPLVISNPNGNAYTQFIDETFPGTYTSFGMFNGSATWEYFNGETSDYFYFGGTCTTFEPSAGGLTQFCLNGLTWSPISLGVNQPVTTITTPNTSGGSNLSGSTLKFVTGSGTGNGSSGFEFFASGGGTGGSNSRGSGFTAKIAHDRFSIATSTTATTTAHATIMAQGTSTSPQMSLLKLASSTGATMFNINNAGHIQTGGGTPTLSSCGTGPSISGNDTSGTVTVGSGVVTSCTITFSTVRTNTPRVVGVVTGGGLNIASGYSAKSTSAVTFSFATTIGSGSFDYLIIE